MSVLPAVVASASPGVAAACVAGAYLLGTFPTARLASRRRGVDPTAAGSRNPGATNVYRTAGRRAGVLTLVGDVLKGAAAAGLGWAVGGHGLGVACGVAAVVGHVAPLTRPSRGGKGVATVAGMALVLFPLAALASGAAFAVVTALTRTVSLGSIAAAVVLPVAAGVLGAPGREVAALVVCAVLVIARHRANLGRLWRGEEPHLGTAA
ncbi:MAG TPA: glycerol-3-phosphate acyltransferase [Acidimicrobiales bacterium]|nr:glycerol-3-phosphate acyltransferase [Acidimicrobiales bacterium]